MSWFRGLLLAIAIVLWIMSIVLWGRSYFGEDRVALRCATSPGAWLCIVLECFKGEIILGEVYAWNDASPPSSGIFVELKKDLSDPNMIWQHEIWPRKYLCWRAIGIQYSREFESDKVLGGYDRRDLRITASPWLAVTGGILGWVLAAKWRRYRRQRHRQTNGLCL